MDNGREMEATIVKWGIYKDYWGSIGIVEKKMETTRV